MRFHSNPIEEHAEVPLADQGRFEELVARFTRDERPEAQRDGSTNDQVNACYVLSVYRPSDADSRDSQLAEILGLVEAQGDRVVGSQTYALTKPDPRTLIRSGVAERIGREAKECGADLLVIDAELSPSQARNLEDASELPVCDREAVILNVFERHATTRRARMQVAIAHLEYLRPRIRGIGLDMDQQAGGIVGSRGAGETASELLARRLDGRLAELRRGLVQLKRSGAAQRKQRERSSRVVLVGYTNAGKTSLMNGLTSAGLSARNRPFETLDTTSRSMTRHGGDVILSDTVGFIRRLPERLFASFESTLAEVAEASLLLIVVDVSDAEFPKHLSTTEEILEKLGAGTLPRLFVFNKTDRLATLPSSDELSALTRGHPYASVSSHSASAVAELRERVIAKVRESQVAREVFVPYELKDVTGLIHASCRVLKSTATDRGIQYVIEGEPHIVDRVVRATRRPRR